jgi:two-component system, cell cycle sensor histidine kinase and response regulator CckA
MHHEPGMNEQTVVPTKPSCWLPDASILYIHPAQIRARTILLVEDESFVRDVACEVLQSAGYTVLAAWNAAEAMRVYSNHASEIDLLLTDMILPGETGLALASKLRRENPRLKILV